MTNFSAMAYVSAEDRRRQLVEAAVRVITRDGVRGLTTRKVAEEAGAPLASIHYAFGTKDDLVEAAVRRVMDDLIAPILSAVDAGAGVAAAIRTVIDTYWAAVRSSPDGELLLSDLFTHDDERARRFALEEYHRYRTFTLGVLGRAADAAGERTAVPLEQVARLLVLCCDGVLMQYELDGDADRAGDDLRAVAEALVGLAAPSRAAAPAPSATAGRQRRRHPTDG